MNSKTTFNVVEGQLVRYFCDRPENAWDGFELWETGGGFHAYAKNLDGNRYIFICDNNNQIDDLSDTNFIVSLEEEGFPLAHVLRQTDTQDGRTRIVVEVENCMGDPSTIEEALAGFGIFPIEVK